MKNTKDILINNILEILNRSILELLEVKHLYQNINIDFSSIDKQISSFEYSDFFRSSAVGLITKSNMGIDKNLRVKVERKVDLD